MRRFLIALAVFVPAIASAQNRPMTLTDLMSMPTLRNPVISANGVWMGYDTWPDRGNGQAVVKEIAGRRNYTIPNGERPVFSADGAFAAASIRPDVISFENAKPSDRPKPGLVYFPTSTGTMTTLSDVKSFRFTGDSRRILVWYAASKPGSGWRKTVGSGLDVRSLTDTSVTSFAFVSAMASDSLGTQVFLAIADSSGQGNALIRFRPASGSIDTLRKAPFTRFDQLTWNETSQTLAFLAATETEDQSAEVATLHLVNASLRTLEFPFTTRYIPLRNSLRWSDHGDRLFFGTKPEAEKPVTEPKRDEWTAANFTDTEFIRNDRGLDIWHGDDPLIKPHEIKTAAQRGNRTFLTVWHRQADRMVALADSTLPQVTIPSNGRIAVGTSNVPYQREISWFGTANDVMLVDMETGERSMVLERYSGVTQLSPSGDWLLYFADGHWHSIRTESGVRHNLSKSIATPFADEDHDRPDAPGGYGIAGWLENETRVLIYDKFDLWAFDPAGRSFANLTRTGRTEKMQYRIRRTDTKPYFAVNQPLLLTGYHDLRKTTGFYELRMDRPSVTLLVDESKKLTFVAKADAADVVLYTRESYNEFPDVWSTDTRFRNRTKQTDVNPVMSQLAWGTSQLVEWSSMDGTPVQGVLITPGGWKPGTRLPVIVYFYELFSQRLHEYNALAVNHRPSFPYYASNGYAIFLPDVRYDLGQPGYSSTKFIVPGVQKLIDMGIADPARIGIHGHSWSGYQAAHIITQTNLFAAAIVGAPVSNMTSAYNGIRWGTGLSRQFQYEQQQSRIGRTMWEARDLYIENSPVFFADRIKTPTLIMFGDEDDAVPWYQGIELYLAMRRLDKDVIFLQYHGEPHHPQRYANKMDYTIRMKEYFDHYLKGLPAAEWIRMGEKYTGK
jgi:dipeptidyl aminopeptidase/acylaminoacyl peptidase